MKDNKGIIQQVSNLESLNLGLNFKLYLLIVFFALLILMPSYTLSADKSEFKFSKDQQIQQVKPKKPVRIKLHRNAKGEYSWDLTGDNVDEVFRADRRLRKLLKME